MFDQSRKYNFKGENMIYQIKTQTRKPFIIFLLLITFFILCISEKQYSQSVGVVTGKVVDASNGEELIGANILLQGTMLGAASDLNGNFIVRNIPAGNYTLIASMIGYTKVTVTDVNITDNSTLKLDISLKPEAYETEEVLITAKL